MLLIGIKGQYQTFLCRRAGIEEETDILTEYVGRSRQCDSQRSQIGTFTVRINPAFIFKKGKLVFPQTHYIDLFESCLLQVHGR